MRRASSPRGFVLIVVLMLLVVLTMVASLAYTRASDHLVISTGLKRQAIAQDRALVGMQRGVADVKKVPKPAYLAALEAVAPCNLAKALDCFPAYPTPAPATMGLVTGTGTDLASGGGPLYQVDFVRWRPMGATSTLVVIRSTGFHGFSPAAVPGATQFTSQVLVELSEGRPNEGGCVGYCGGGL